MLSKIFKGVDRILNGPNPYLHLMPSFVVNDCGTYDENDDPEQSPYYWWFQYLLRHEGYKHCCSRGGTGPYSKLYRDWGNIHSGDMVSWFEDHMEHLFAEPKAADTLMEIRYPSELEKIDWNSVMVVVSPIRNGAKLLSKKDIKLQFSDMVDRRFGEKPGRPNYKSTAKYQIAGSPVLHVLKEMLAVYDRRLEHLVTLKAGQRRRMNFQPASQRVKKYRQVRPLVVAIAMWWRVLAPQLAIGQSPSVA